MNAAFTTEKTRALQYQAGLSRRAFLRGVGACLALPAFQSLRPLQTLAAGAASSRLMATTATGAPLRTAFLYFPNGAIPSAWWPASTGSDFTLNRTMEPLAKVKEHI